MNKEIISVIVTVRNAEKTIGECIESILNQDYVNFELIIVDANSTDGTEKKLKNYKKNKKVKTIYLDKKVGTSEARNIGIKISKGKFIAFTDSDCKTGRNWLTELRKGFYEEKTASVGGPNLIPKDDSVKARCVARVLSFYSKAGSYYVFNSKEMVEVEHNPTSNSMYRRKVLLELNRFNERIVSNEDAELDYKIRKKGFKILFNPKAVVYHHRRDSFKKFFHQAKWFGVGRMQAIKLDKGMIEWFRFIPSIVILILILSVILSFYFFPALLFFALVFSILLISFFFSALYLSLKTKPSYFFNYFILLGAWFFGYGIGVIEGVFK
ncbi:MAG: glycosyltransferase [archaeon]